MAEGLGFPRSLVGVLRVLPRAGRDRMYAFLARNRLRIFGKRAACYMGEPRDRDRFLA
jgi:predicted DCC family thiol-disulfide oxidoreductase YuxK